MYKSGIGLVLLLWGTWACAEAPPTAQGPSVTSPAARAYGPGSLGPGLKPAQPNFDDAVFDSVGKDPKVGRPTTSPTGRDYGPDLPLYQGQMEQFRKECGISKNSRECVREKIEENTRRVEAQRQEIEGRLNSPTEGRKPSQIPLMQEKPSFQREEENN